jgi:hypothetical protein
MIRSLKKIVSTGDWREHGVRHRINRVPPAIVTCRYDIQPFVKRQTWKISALLNSMTV